MPLADHFAGRSVACPACGRQVGVAHKSSASTGAAAGNVPAGGAATAGAVDPEVAAAGISTKTIVIIVVGVVTLIVLLGGCLMWTVFFPAIARVSAKTEQLNCTSQLRNIGPAMRAYAISHGDRLPPAYTVDKQGRRLHSWRVLLLPYLEEQSLFDRIKLDEPWDSPHNRRFHDQMPDIFSCPSSRDGDLAHTSYAVVVGPEMVFTGEQGRRISSILDGQTRTVMVVEAAGAGLHWMEPKDLDAEQLTFRINSSGTEISSGHPDGCNVLMADTSTRFLDESLDPATVRALLTADGGEKTDGF